MTHLAQKQVISDVFSLATKQKKQNLSLVASNNWVKNK